MTQTVPQPNQPPKLTRKLTLASVTRGKQWNPLRILIYGPDKVGKTSWAVGARPPLYNKGADDAIVLQTESGAELIDVARFPLAETWDDVLGAVDELSTGEHKYSKLVVDSVDWLEGLARDYVCAKHGKSNLEAFGFGKGYSLVFDEMRTLLFKLERLRVDRKMHIIGVAHSAIRTFKNPEGPDFDRYEAKLQASNNANVAGLWKEWPEYVLFANFEVLTNDKDGKVKGVTSPSRYIGTRRTAAYDAGSRLAIPEKLPLDWATFAREVKAAFDKKED
jgi:hypothetical protein